MTELWHEPGEVKFPRFRLYTIRFSENSTNDEVWSPKTQRPEARSRNFHVEPWLPKAPFLFGPNFEDLYIEPSPEGGYEPGVYIT